MKKVIFAGTPGFAVPCLRALVDMPTVEVQAVYTQPDRPKGRGQKLQPSPVKAFAESCGLPIYQPAKLNTTEEIERLAEFEPDMMIVVAYGQLLSQTILQIPQSGCLNVHASLLPRWRGAAPIHRAIEAGDEQTGVCLMKMDVGLDTGPVYAQRSLPITQTVTTPALHDQLAQLGADLLREELGDILSGQRSAKAQSEAAVTYAHKLTKEEAAIDWSQSAEIISRKIRAFQPWPGAQTTWNGDLLKIWEASVVDQSDTATPGTVLSADKAGIVVQCGEACLLITQLQPAGKARMSVEAFLSSRTLAGAMFC